MLHSTVMQYGIPLLQRSPKVSSRFSMQAGQEQAHGSAQLILESLGLESLYSPQLAKQINMQLETYVLVAVMPLLIETLLTRFAGRPSNDQEVNQLLEMLVNQHILTVTPKYYQYPSTFTKRYIRKVY